MKKILCIFLSGIMMLSLLACSGEKESEKKVFRHGFDLDYPPYSFINEDGTMGGFDVELAQAMCEHLGWEYQAVPFNWDAKDAELNSGNCDCIWSGFTINGREDDYVWSKPYSDNTQMIMVKTDSDIKKLSDLAGKTVGIQSSTSAYELLKDDMKQADLCDSFKRLEVYETYSVAFNDLKADAIDAIAIDVTSGRYLMSNSDEFRFLDEMLGSEQYAIGFRKGDEELRDTVEKALDDLVEDGTFEKIADNYPEIKNYLCLK